MKNLGTLGCCVSLALLLGRSLSSGVPFLSEWAWKTVGLLVALLIAVVVFIWVGRQFNNKVIAWLSGGATMAILVILLGLFI